MSQIATFHTHLGALRLFKKLQRLGDAEAAMMPVPRRLSASCGTCVRFSLPFEAAWADEDLDAVYIRTETGYQAVFVQEE